MEIATDDGRGARRRVRRLMGVGMTLGFLAAGACGGGGEKAPTAVAAADATTTTEPGSAFAACLRDHGVDLPDRQRGADGAGGPPPSRPEGSRPSTSFPPGSRPSTSLPAGVDPAKAAAARQACQSLQPADRGMATGPQGQAFQAYASCMKDRGINVNPGGGAGSINRDDPAFKAGDAVCGVLRPTPTQP